MYILPKDNKCKHNTPFTKNRLKLRVNSKKQQISEVLLTCFSAYRIIVSVKVIHRKLKSKSEFVKCLSDGELSAGRRHKAAVRALHPAS